MKSMSILVSIIILLFVYSSEMTWVTMAMMAPICILAPLSARLFQFTAKKALKIRSEMSAVAQEALGNIRTVKAFSSEREAYKSFADKNGATFDIGRTMAIYRAWMDGFWQWFFVGAFVGMMWYAVKLYRDPEKDMTVGTLFMFLMYNWMVVGQVMTLGETISQVFKIRGAFYEMAKLILESDVQEGYYAEKEVTDEMEASTEGNIQFAKVKFEYPSKPDVPVLKDISIRVDDNQIVALVGTSGCGKTSMVSLIERFYDPTDGAIFYNGNNINELDTRWYHKKQIALVSQEPVLFSESVKNNILYGVDLEGVSDADIEERLKIACD